jgi:hypothetical protein
MDTIGRRVLGGDAHQTQCDDPTDQNALGFRKDITRYRWVVA